MAWDNAVVTNAGVALLKDVLAGGVLTLDDAAGGTGTVPAASLMAQTALKEQKQQFTIVSSMNVTNGKKIKIQITNLGLTAGYTLNQIGIWAHVDSGTPVLFAILQDDSGIAVPAESELADFVLSFYAVVNFSNEAEFTVTVDSSALVSMSTLTEALKGKADLGEDGKIPESQLPEMDYIPTSEKGAASGVAELDSTGKVPESQLPEMDYIPTSEKGAVSGVAELDATGKVPESQLPIGSISQYGALKAKEGNGLVLVDGVLSFQLTEVATPAQEGTLTYTGAEQSPSWGGYDMDKMILSGTTSATDAGTYTAIFNLLSTYKWEDGSTGSKSVTWTIGKATGSMSINPTSLSMIGAVGTTGTIAVTRTGDGAITAKSSNTSVATVSVSGTTVSVKSVASGSATITVTVAEGTNYTAPVSKTCAATITAASATLNSNSWATIFAIAKAGLASSLWSIGDEKDITLTTGETLTLQIYDFGHDALSDGSGYAPITFGMKNLMTDARAMNSTNTNVGSFTGSELYAWITGDLWNSLPSDLQAVIRPVTKYTAAGGTSTTINAEKMKVFLFSEVELFGSVTYSAAGEGSQYPIFTDNVSRIKYLSNGKGAAKTWWQRSPAASTNAGIYCVVYENGGATYNTDIVAYGLGINFGFCI